MNFLCDFLRVFLIFFWADVQPLVTKQKGTRTIFGTFFFGFESDKFFSLYQAQLGE